MARCRAHHVDIYPDERKDGDIPVTARTAPEAGRGRRYTDRDIAALSQASAARWPRLTVAGETPITSATSSTVRPPK